MSAHLLATANMNLGPPCSPNRTLQMYFSGANVETAADTDGSLNGWILYCRVTVHHQN